MIDATYKWHCNFCEFSTESESEMALHLSQCKHNPRNNPRNRGCGTCGNKYNGDQDECNRIFCKASVKDYPNCLQCNYWIHTGLAHLMQRVTVLLNGIHSAVTTYQNGYTYIQIPPAFVKALRELTDIVDTTLGK